MATFKTVRVVTGTKPPQYRAVNIVTSGSTTYPTYLQTTLDDRTFETVYNVGSPAVAGLETVIISGATPAPAVTSVSPSSGSTAGGDSITVAGTNFTGATAVKFGATDAASFVVDSDIQITATTPAGSAGAVHTTVTTPGGTSSTGAGDVYTYAVQAIAFVGAADGGNVTTTSAMTWSYTCGSGSNRLLVVGVLGDATSDFISGVTYGGVSMTLAGSHQADAQRWSYLFFLLNPASGANDVVVSASTPTSMFSGAADYIGVKQSGQPDASALGESDFSATSLTTSITTVVDNDWVVLFENGFSSSNPPSADTGDILRVVDATFGAWGLFDSNGPVTPAGSYSMKTTRPLSVNGIGHILAAFSHA
jgi:hypothetical protein